MLSTVQKTGEFRFRTKKGQNGKESTSLPLDIRPQLADNRIYSLANDKERTRSANALAKGKRRDTQDKKGTDYGAVLRFLC